VCDCMEMFCEKGFRVKREAEVSDVVPAGVSDG
jgi:hypothetical protein